MNAQNDGKPVTVAGFDGPYWKNKEEAEAAARKFAEDLKEGDES